MTGPSSAARKTPLTLLEYAASDTKDRPKVKRRELEVLELVSEGLSTREISRRLWITEETVKTHVRRMHNRLAARTRAHAVAIAFRKGILR
jgi:DNA-binding CsgD family transcriptional regulator